MLKVIGVRRAQLHRKRDDTTIGCITFSWKSGRLPIIILLHLTTLKNLSPQHIVWAHLRMFDHDVDDDDARTSY